MNLSQYVLGGELYFHKAYSMHGYIGIDGWEVPLALELVGWPEADLKFTGLRFETRPEERAALARVLELNAADLKLQRRAIANRQIGVTGQMTANAWVRTFDCPIIEFYNRSKVGEQPPTEWKRKLYLEWFSQNGRMVIELADPILEIGGGEDWKPMPPPERPMPEPFDPEKWEWEDDPSMFDITVVRNDEPDEEAQVEHEAFADLQREFDRRNREIEAALKNAGESPREDDESLGDDLHAFLDNEPEPGSQEAHEDFLTEMEVMEQALEETGEPIPDLFGAPRRLTPAEEMNDEELEGQLKVLLLQLANAHIAIDVCEHFGPRELYGWLLREIITDGRFHPRMAGTGWVQHYSTWEYCPACEAQNEADYERMEDELKEKREEEDADDA